MKNVYFLRDDTEVTKDECDCCEWDSPDSVVHYKLGDLI